MVKYLKTYSGSLSNWPIYSSPRLYVASSSALVAPQLCMGTIRASVAPCAVAMGKSHCSDWLCLIAMTPRGQDVRFRDAAGTSKTSSGRNGDLWGSSNAGCSRRESSSLEYPFTGGFSSGAALFSARRTAMGTSLGRGCMTATTRGRRRAGPQHSGTLSAPRGSRT